MEESHFGAIFESNLDPKFNIYRRCVEFERGKSKIIWYTAARNNSSSSSSSFYLEILLFRKSISSDVPGVVTISDCVSVRHSVIGEGISGGDFCWGLLRLHHSFVVHGGGWQSAYRLPGQVVIVVQIGVILELETLFGLGRGVRRLRERGDT